MSVATPRGKLWGIQAPLDASQIDANFDALAQDVLTQAAAINALAATTGALILPIKTPVDSNFTWINQGAASVTTSALNGGIFLRAPASAGDQLRIRKRTAMTPPYTVTAAFLGNLVNLNFQAFGLVFRESGSGKLQHFGAAGNTNSGGAATGAALSTSKWTNPTTFSADYSIRGFDKSGALLWLRIADNGVNRICSFSADGENFIQFHSIIRTDFLTADEVGWFGNDNTNVYEVGVTLISWAEATQ